MSMVFLSVSHTVKKVPPRNSKNTRSRHFLSIQNKKALRQKSKAFLWSGRRDSNSQQPAWKAGTLAIELLPHILNIIQKKIFAILIYINSPELILNTVNSKKNLFARRVRNLKNKVII